MRIVLPEPEYCRRCGTRGRVVDSRRSKRGWRRRRHECQACDRRWSSWQSLINPARIKLREAPAAPKPGPTAERQSALPFP